MSGCISNVEGGKSSANRMVVGLGLTGSVSRQLKGSIHEMYIRQHCLNATWF